MMQEMKSLSGMIFKRRGHRFAMFSGWKFLHRKMAEFRHRMMIVTMRIDYIGSGGNNEQGKKQQANIWQVFLLFKEPWKQKIEMRVEKNDHEHMTDKVPHLEGILKRFQ